MLSGELECSRVLAGCCGESGEAATARLIATATARRSTTPPINTATSTARKTAISEPEIIHG
jgi:hypothetical protein